MFNICLHDTKTHNQKQKSTVMESSPRKEEDREDVFSFFLHAVSVCKSYYHTQFKRLNILHSFPLVVATVVLTESLLVSHNKEIIQTFNIFAYYLNAKA